MELKVYKRHEVPREIAAQIRSYARIQWPYVQAQSGKIWDFTPWADAPIHFVLMQDEVVVTHASVNHRNIEFDGETLNCFGLSTVFTYPAFRKGGHARRVVGEATKHIRESDGDLAMLFCGQGVRPLYISLGWTEIEGARVLFGEKEKPGQYEGVVMMLPITKAGAQAVEKMKHQSVYVGPETW